MGNMLSHIDVENIRSFIRRKKFAEKIESLFSDEMIMIGIGISFLIILLYMICGMKTKRRKYSIENIPASVEESSNTHVPPSKLNTSTNSGELHVYTHSEEKKRKPFGYNATKAFAMSPASSRLNSRGTSPTSTIASADDGSAILSEAAYRNKRPGTNPRVKKLS